MDSKIAEILERAKATAITAASAAGKAADSAQKMAGDFFGATKLNLTIFDTNTDIELLFKEIGKLVYLTHTGVEVDEGDINEKIGIIDEKYAKIRELRQEIEKHKSILKCHECGFECDKEDVFCRSCGTSL